MSSRPARSPVARYILIGLEALNQAMAGKPCLYGCRAGEHKASCLVGEAFIQDPVVAAQAKAAKGDSRG
jgi:hypothetical protein